MATIITDNDQERVADFYLRLMEHIKMYGAPKRNDKQIWNWVDEMTEQTLSDMVTFAIHNKYWDHSIRDWLIEVSERAPFYMRNISDKRRSSDNNNNIWRLLMLMRESIEYRLKEEDNPRNRLFTQ